MGVLIDKEELRLLTSRESVDRLRLGVGWFAVSYKWVSDDRQRRLTRRCWCRLTGPSGSTYRLIRFGGIDMAKNEIAIDWEGWVAIAGADSNQKTPLPITIRTVHGPMTVLCPLWHQDPVYRLSYLLGLVSLALGILSVILAVLV